MARRLRDLLSELRTRSTLERLFSHHDAAIANLELLLEQRPSLGRPGPTDRGRFTGHYVAATQPPGMVGLAKQPKERS